MALFEPKIRVIKWQESPKICLTWQLWLKYSIKRLSSLFLDVFHKDKENSSLNMTVFDKLSC